MAAKLRELKDRAAELVAKAKFKRAAEAYRQILEADRRDVDSRHKLAEVLRRAGDDDGAIAEYRRVADAYARDGLLIKAIAVCKAILEVDSGHGDTQRMLADLYASKQSGSPATASAASGIRGAVPRRPPAAEAEEPEGRVELPLPPVPRRGAEVIVPPPPDDRAVKLPPELDPSLGAEESASTAFEIILETAEQARGAGVEDALIEADEPLEVVLADMAEPALPRIPLFSDLSPVAFQALTERLDLKRVSPGEVVLHQGAPGDSFYVIASGLFRVEKVSETGAPVVLAHLEDGAFFGEMALLSGEPRAASVVAETAGELLEIRADVLTALCREHPHVADSLARFYRQRLLANAMATSPLFRPFSPEERKAIMLRFRTRRVAAGERVITEGLPSDGLYVVLSGSLDVLKRTGATEVPAGALREGDVFGEMSCLRKTPASATVVARRAGTLLRLPRADFDELIVTYPQILELVADLADDRQHDLEAIVEGGVQWTEEGLVLI